MTSAITMTGLTKHYKDVEALTDLTLDVPAGTVFGFLGPNGAGKSTALKVLAGLARATAGSATVDGVPVSAAGEHRRQLGYLAQDPRFYGWMTGRETLRYVARFRGVDARPRAVDRVAARAGRHRRRRRSADVDVLRRHAPAAGHRPGAGRPAGGPPPRRARVAPSIPSAARTSSTSCAS